MEHLLRDVKDTTISTLANEVCFLTVTSLKIAVLFNQFSFIQITFPNFVIDSMYRARRLDGSIRLQKALAYINVFFYRLQANLLL